MNTIKALYLTHTTVTSPDEKSGHAVTILKIRNKWYISDNEIGLLHEVNDEKFIYVLFYKLYQANNNTKYEICQMWHTSQQQKTDQNLAYFFVFDVGGRPYIYPNSNVPGSKTMNTPIVTAERTIIFTYSEEVKDSTLDAITNKLTQSEDEFVRYLTTAEKGYSSA